MCIDGKLKLLPKQEGGRTGGNSAELNEQPDFRKR